MAAQYIMKVYVCIICLLCCTNWIFKCNLGQFSCFKFQKHVLHLHIGIVFHLQSWQIWTQAYSAAHVSLSYCVFVLCCVKDMYKKHTGLYIDTLCDTNAKMPSMLTVNYYLSYKVYISTLQLDLVQRSEVVTKDYCNAVRLCIRICPACVLLTYSKEQRSSWEAKQFSASQEIPCILCNMEVHDRITHARHLSLSWACSIQSIPPHPTSWRFILILSSHLRLGLPSGLFSSNFSTQILYMPLLSPIHATCPVSLILNFITQRILVEEYRSLSYSVCSFLHSPVTLSILGPNILNTWFSNTLSLHSSLNVSDQVLHPYKITSKIVVLYILIFKVLDSKLEDKIFCTEW